MGYKKNRRDANEKELVKFWRSMGWKWKSIPPGVGYDGILSRGNKRFVVEIKNPAYQVRLTPEERECQAEMKEMGGIYNIVTNLDEAMDLIGIERMKK